MPNGLEKFTYGTPKPETKEAFSRGLREIIRQLTETKEPTGFIGRPYEPPEYKQKPLYGVPKPKEPEITESREYTAGQISEEELERKNLIKAQKDEYRQALSQVYTSQEDITQLNRMELIELEESWNNYQEWEMQRREEQITQLMEQLGISTPIAEQIKRAYPEEEFESALTGAGYYTKMMAKDPSAKLIQDFMKHIGLSPEVEAEPEEEPTIGERIEEIKRYRELRGLGEEPMGLGEMPIDISMIHEPFVKDFAQDVIAGLQTENLTPQELLDAVMEAYGMSEINPNGIDIETAKRLINMVAQQQFEQTIDWTLLE